MSLSKAIRVNTRYTRSINIERDRGSRATIQAYIPTMCGMDVLKAVAETLDPGDHPRAWSLIGPYGAGKSSFALFLHELFGTTSNETARQILSSSRPQLAQRFKGLQPWCRVVLTGSDAPLADRLLQALHDAVTEFWADKRGRKPHILKDIEQGCQNGSISHHELLRLIDRLQNALKQNGAGGLLILIDEMGKFLEYETRHAGDGVFLLQQLAERSFGKKANLLLFVLLHQGFDLYARGMGERLKNDWAKVQGRFENVSFVESQDQTLRIIAAAFSNTLSKNKQRALHSRALQIAQSIEQCRSLPISLDADAAADIFAKCYPLHPISLLVLPQLCQRFAQNERTLFSYLGSRELHGFQDALSSIEQGQWILPDRIYDYFVHNQPAVLADPLTHRRWAEVVTAVDRAGSNDRVAADNANQGLSSIMLAKTIGILNLVSRKEGLRASSSILQQLFDSALAFRKALQPLLDASIVQYRKFSDEYRVWQGTDFNIDERILAARSQIGEFDLAATIANRSVTAPILARRHAIRTGALRDFAVAFVDRSARLSLISEPSSISDKLPRIVFFLSENEDDIQTFHAAMANADANEIWASHKSGANIRSAMVDVMALENIEHSAQELIADPVVSREVQSRLQAAHSNEREILAAITSEPALSDFYWRGERLSIENRCAMQQILSDIMDSIYSDTPVIRNELINRTRLSTQAAAARNRLFAHMLADQNKPALGIKKNPPEQAIYRSLFESGHLHMKTDAGWTFVAPDANDPLNLRPTWRVIDKMLEKSETAPITLEYMAHMLEKPPVGLKRGIFPILFLHYFLIHQSETALYEESAYIPELTYEHLERMVRRPDMFSVQRFRVEGMRSDLFDAYSIALFGKVRESLDLLSLARPLTNFMMGLDDYAQKTRRLSKTALQVRQAFFLSKSPQQFLFVELPAACGFSDTKSLSGFSDTLVKALRELKGALSGLRESMRKSFCAGFHLADTTALPDLRRILRDRCRGLDELTVDVQGLRSFIRRIHDADTTDDAWFESMLLFLGHTSPSKWTDEDQDAAEYRLTDFCARIMALEKLRLHQEAVSGSELDHEVILLKTVSSQTGEQDELVVLNSHVEAIIEGTQQEIEKLLAKLTDKDMALAVMARLTSDFLAEFSQTQNRNGISS